MGRRGPAPTPTALKVLHGNPGHRRLNDAEPRPRVADPEPPGWLSPVARVEWDRIAPELSVMGTTFEADAVSLAAYCETVAVFVEACGLVATMGTVITDDEGGLRRNPAVRIAQDAGNQLRAWAREFGLTPSARAGIRVNVTHAGQDAARLFTGG